MTDTTPDFAPIEEDGTGPDRRLLIGGGAVVAVLLALGGYFLLAGGSDSGDEAFVVHKHLPTVVAPSPSASLTVVPPSSKVPLGRDPFKPLYVVPVAAAPAAGSTGTQTGVTPAGGGTSTGGTKTPSGNYSLTLTSVTGTKDSRTAAFNAGGQKLSAQVGSDFGLRSELKLLALAQGIDGKWVARVQVGDDSPFDVYQGQAISVP